MVKDSVIRVSAARWVLIFVQKGGKEDCTGARRLILAPQNRVLPPALKKASRGIFVYTNNYPTFALQKFSTMARVCQVTGKRPITGNKVSHSNIKTKRRFLPNLQTKRYFLAEEDKWVTLKVSSEAIRTINKNGLYSVVKGLRAAGEKI